jgi:hypothetical protein
LQQEIKEKLGLNEMIFLEQSVVISFQDKVLTHFIGMNGTWDLGKPQ